MTSPSSSRGRSFSTISSPSTPWRSGPTIRTRQSYPLLYTFTRPLPPKSLSIRPLAPSGFALLPPPACAKPATSAPTPLVSGVSPLLPSLDLAVLDSDYRPLLSPLPTFALTVLSIRPSISPGKTTVPRSTRETTPHASNPLWFVASSSSLASLSAALAF